MTTIVPTAEQRWRKAMSDLIRKQEVLNLVENTPYDWSNITERTEMLRKINALPSAEPKTKCIAQIRIDRDDIEDLVNEKVNEIVEKMSESKTGRWIDDCTCSICHWIHEDDNGFALITKYNFCPNCGAKMEIQDRKE